MSDPNYWARRALAAMNGFTESMAGCIIPHDEEHHFDELMDDVARWTTVLQNRVEEFDYSNGIVVETDDDDDDDNVIDLTGLAPPPLQRQVAVSIVVTDSESDDDTMSE